MLEMLSLYDEAYVTFLTNQGLKIKSTYLVRRYFWGGSQIFSTM